MLEYLRLSNVGPAPEMELNLESRLNLITGDNGLGKSFLLDVAWWAMTRRWPHEVNRYMTSGFVARPTNIKQTAHIDFRVTGKRKSVEYSSTYVPRDEAWTGRAGRPPNPGLVIYAHADGSFSVWDPARNYWKKKGNVDVQERLPAYVFTPKEVWDGLTVEVDGQATIVCNGLIRDWASWIKEDGTDARNMAIMLDRLSVSGDPRDVLEPGTLIRISLTDARDIPSIRTSYGLTVPILHASAGVRRVAALAYMLLWSWREHHLAARQLGESSTRQVTMLVDELESHLHPRWQRSILGSLLRIVNNVLHKQARVQLITATHSPLVLASVEPLFDPKRDAWFDIDLRRNGNKAEVRLERREFVPHGDVSNWLTSEAFDLKIARSMEAERAIERARALLRRKRKPTREQVREVDKELRVAGLPGIDPFWIRWGAYIESLERGR